MHLTIHRCSGCPLADGEHDCCRHPGAAPDLVPIWGLAASPPPECPLLRGPLTVVLVVEKPESADVEAP